LKYIRRVTPVDLSEEPTQSSVQYADHLFSPLLLPDETATSKGVAVPTLQYVDLTNADHAIRSEYVGNVVVSYGINTVTLSTYPIYERRFQSAQRRAPVFESHLKATTIEKYLAHAAAPKNSLSWLRPPLRLPFQPHTLALPPTNPTIVYYDRPPLMRLGNWLSNADFSGLVVLIVDRANFDTKIVNKANAVVGSGAVSGDVDLFLCIKHQSHRDVDASNDEDKAPKATAFSQCSLYLRGFQLSSGSVKVEEIDLGITLFSKLDKADALSTNRSSKIHTILRDESAPLLASQRRKSYACAWAVNKADPAREPDTVVKALLPREWDEEIDPLTRPSLVKGSVVSLFFNQVYTADLDEFITILVKQAAEDENCKRLYDLVFAHCVTPGSDPPTLRFGSDGFLDWGGFRVNEGMLLEAANTLAIWKIARGLGLLRWQLKHNVEQSVGDFANDFERVMDAYPFFHNMVEALRAAGVKTPVEAAGSNANNQFDSLLHHYHDIFRHDNPAGHQYAAPRKLGIQTDLYDYTKHPYYPSGPVTKEGLRQALEALDKEKRDYVSFLSECIYRGLGGRGLNPRFVNIAVGDGTATSGLLGFNAWIKTSMHSLGFGDGSHSGAGPAVFLFNYNYSGDLSTTESAPLASLPIFPSGTNATVVHWATYGVENSKNISQDVVVLNRRGHDVNTDVKRLIVPQGDHSFTGTIPSSLSLHAKWKDETKELYLEDPVDRTLGSVDITVNTLSQDEQSWLVVSYTAVEQPQETPIAVFAKDFYNLFADDSFVVTEYKRVGLWAGDDAGLEEIVNILSKGNSQIKLKSIIGGGVARGRTDDAFDESRAYVAGAMVRHQGGVWRALVGTQPGKPFDPLQWIRDSRLTTDSDYVFKVQNTGLPTQWGRLKDDDTDPPNPGDQNDLRNDVYALLRYSFASIEFQPTPDQKDAGALFISVESYASPLVSNLHQFKVIQFDDGNGVTPVTVEAGLRSATDPLSETFSFKFLPHSTIKLQEENEGKFSSGARMPDGRDVYNPLLSALRSCGLLNAILERIHDAAPNDPAVTSKLSTFWNDPSVKVRYVKGEPGTVVKDTFLDLATFRKLIGRPD